MCLSIHVSQDPLQDPCLRIHISASICISGSSTRSTSSDQCLSIFVSHGFSARSMSPDSCLSIFISQDPLQDPCLRIHVSDSCLSIHQYGSSARSMSPDSCFNIFVSQDSVQDPCLRIHVSASLYLRILCKIHVSGSIYQHPYVSQDPLQDPCLRAHVSASICISRSSEKSMSPDPCLRLISQHPLTRIRCMIHVSVSMSRHPYLWSSKIHISAFIPVDPAQNRHGARLFVALRKENMPIEILHRVSRRRNAHFDLPKRILSGPAQAKRKFRPPETRFVWPCAGKTVRPRSALMFRAGEMQILTCRDAFFWPCAGETQI